MSVPKVSIVADSRGALLKEELNKVFTDIPFHLYWKKGLRLIDSIGYVEPTLLNLKPKLIYFLNGICDVTYLRSRDPWEVALRHPHVQNCVLNYMIAVDHTLNQTFSLSEKLGYKPMVLFPTLTGINIASYNNYSPDQIAPEQPILDEAIHKINTNLIGLHKSMSIQRPLLSSAVHMRCRGKFRMANSKLINGCHPTQELCGIWAERLYTNAKMNLYQYDYYSLIN